LRTIKPQLDRYEWLIERFDGRLPRGASGCSFREVWQLQMAQLRTCMRGWSSLPVARELDPHVRTAALSFVREHPRLGPFSLFRTEAGLSYRGDSLPRRAECCGTSSSALADEDDDVNDRDREHAPPRGQSNDQPS
jgi:hypothetical protein